RVAGDFLAERAGQRFARVGDAALAVRELLDRFRFARRFFHQLFRVLAAVPAVAGVLRVGDLAQVDVAGVAEEAVVLEGVVCDFVAEVVVVADVLAFDYLFHAALAVRDWWRSLGVGIRDEQDPPRAVVVDLVFVDDVVVAAGYHDAAADRPGFRGP